MRPQSRNGGPDKRRIIIPKTTKTKKFKELLAKQKRRQGRAGRQLARPKKKEEGIITHEQTRRLEITIATHDVRTIALHGKHGPGRAVEG